MSNNVRNVPLYVCVQSDQNLHWAFSGGGGCKDNEDSDQTVHMHGLI